MMVMVFVLCRMELHSPWSLFESGSNQMYGSIDVKTKITQMKTVESSFSVVALQHNIVVLFLCKPEMSRCTCKPIDSSETHPNHNLTSLDTTSVLVHFDRLGALTFG